MLDKKNTKNYSSWQGKQLSQILQENVSNLSFQQLLTISNSFSLLASKNRLLKNELRETAIFYAKSSLNKNPLNVSTYLQLYYLARLLKEEKSERYLKAAETIDPFNRAVLTRSAAYCLASCPNPKKENYLESVAHLLFDAGQAGANVLASYSQWLLENGRVEKSLELSNRIVKYFPDNLAAGFSRVNYLILSGNWSAADSLLQRISKKKQLNWPAFERATIKMTRLSLNQKTIFPLGQLLAKIFYRHPNPDKLRKKLVTLLKTFPQRKLIKNFFIPLSHLGKGQTHRLYRFPPANNPSDQQITIGEKGNMPTEELLIRYTNDLSYRDFWGFRIKVPRFAKNSFSLSWQVKVPDNNSKRVLLITNNIPYNLDKFVVNKDDQWLTIMLDSDNLEKEKLPSISDIQGLMVNTAGLNGQYLFRPVILKLNY